MTKHTILITAVAFSAAVNLYAQNIPAFEKKKTFHIDGKGINIDGNFNSGKVSAGDLEVNADGNEVKVELKNFVVTGTRQPAKVSEVPNSITIIDSEKLNDNFRTSVIPTITEQTPGLFSTSRGILGYGVSTGAAGSMKVRGVGGGSELLVLIDGQPQYAGLMGHPIPDAYQTIMAEKVEVLRGPASLYYGSNAMGGVVNIVTKNPPVYGHKTFVQLQGGSYGTWQADAFHRFSTAKLTGTFGAQYQRTDGHRANSEFEQMGGYGKIGYSINSNWSASADINITHFNASNPGENFAPLIDNDSKITRGLASVNLSNIYDNLKGTLRAYIDWGHHNIDDGYKEGATPKAYLYKHNDFIGGICWYETTSLFKGNALTFGVDWQHFGGSAWNENKTNGRRTYLVKNAEGDTLRSQSADEIAGYLDFKQKLAKWLSINAGLRVDHHSVIGTELVPQGGLTFVLNDNAEIKALASKGFRNPTIREMYMFPPATTDLKPERMMNYELSYSMRFSNKGHLGMNLFFIDGENLITTTRVDGRPKNINAGDFINKGFEISGDYAISNHLQMNANYSFLHMNTPVIGAPEHKAYVGANYHYNDFSVATGIQRIDGLYISTGNNAAKEYFTLWNATISYKVAPAATVFVKGENILAQHYQTYSGYYMPRATFMGGVKFVF